MRLNSRRILKAYAFSSLGAGTVNVPFPVYDVSHGLAMTGILTVTGTAADATDTLDVKIQESRDNFVTVNTRARFLTVNGSQVASVSVPQVREINLIAVDTVLTATEQSYITTGSAGGAELAAGSVRNGPLIGPMRDAAGWHPSYRASIVVVSGNAAAFSGILDLYLVSYT